MGEWKEVELSAIADVQTGPFGSQLHASDYVPVGVPVIMPNNIGQRLTLDESNMSYITEADATRLARYKVQEGDIVFSRRGDVDKCILIDARKSGWFCGTGCLFARGNSTEADRTFVAYQFDGPVLKHWLRAHAVGTTMPNLNSTILGAAPVALPELSEQRAIASVLSSLDAKIDLLHRQNKTLEAMAEALFKQWFVEEVKEGWTQRPLSSIATFLNGVACQKYPAKDPANRLPVLKIKELGSGITDSSDWATSTIDPKYHVVAGDVVFSWSATLMVKLWDGPKAVLNQHLFKVTSEEFPKWFYYMWTKHYVDEFVAIATSHATTFGHIKRGDLDEAMVVVPGAARLDEMTLVMEPLFGKHITNSAQIKSLTALRDTLLPILMSGEVRVKHVREPMTQTTKRI